ncbi:hypothetical protein DD238_006292 [Peronospora effusa]|uniref:Uncharacterized protein n=1 Tax=Peronospora effusa TaxID=542832 RepID=A0A3M6VN78_9STRA|nr:hypothetical protein DD238_006292 [Peronospora effusa]RQM09295.1 hypothetical protein DD237_008566 [Peronospora effusa]
MSRVSEMSSNDTVTSDVLTSVSNVTTAVRTVTSGIAPDELSGDSATASLCLTGMLGGGSTLGSGNGSGLHLASGSSVMASTLPILTVLSCASSSHPVIP